MSTERLQRVGALVERLGQHNGVSLQADPVGSARLLRRASGLTLPTV